MAKKYEQVIADVETDVKNALTTEQGAEVLAKSEEAEPAKEEATETVAEVEVVESPEVEEPKAEDEEPAKEDEVEVPEVEEPKEDEEPAVEEVVEKSDEVEAPEVEEPKAEDVAEPTKEDEVEAPEVEEPKEDEEPAVEEVVEKSDEVEAPEVEEPKEDEKPEPVEEVEEPKAEDVAEPTKEDEVEAPEVEEPKEDEEPAVEELDKVMKSEVDVLGTVLGTVEALAKSVESLKATVDEMNLARKESISKSVVEPEGKGAVIPAPKERVSKSDEAQAELVEEPAVEAPAQAEPLDTFNEDVNHFFFERGRNIDPRDLEALRPIVQSTYSNTVSEEDRKVAQRILNNYR